MSESLKGFHTVLIRDPFRSQIKVKWDRITQEDFERVKVVWWCIGEHEAANYSLWRDTTQFLIDVKPGKTYIVAARAHFSTNPHTGIAESYWTKWAYAIVEVPQEESKYLPHYATFGWAEIIQTPRGPAILLLSLQKDECS